MRLGILLTPLLVFDNCRARLVWASTLVMTVLVIFRPSSKSAMGGIRKEVDMHMDFMGTEHVEHKTDHQLQRKMVRFWKCSAVTLHENQTFYVGDTEPESDHVYYQWNKMKNLPGWWVKKIWHSYDGWVLVAKKEEFSLLIVDPPRQLDQRILVEETISSEGSMESQRQWLHI